MRHAMQVRGTCRGMVMGILAVAILAMVGCNDFYGEKKYYTKTISDKELKTIDAFPVEELVLQNDEKTEESKGNEPEVMSLTLDQCRVTALENNLSLKVSMYTPSISREAIRFQKAAFEPYLFDDFSYYKTDTPTSLTLDASQAEVYNNTAGIEIPLKNGATIQFSTPYNRTETNNIFATLNPSYTADGTFTYKQHLLRDGGVETVTSGIRDAYYEMGEASAKVKGEAISLLSTVDIIYWNVYAYQKELEVRIQEQALAKAQVDRAQRMFEAGQLEQLEVLRAEVELAQKNDIVVKLEKTLREQERELKWVLNMPDLPVSGKTRLALKTEPHLIKYEFDADKLIDLAMQKRTEIIQYDYSVAKAENAIRYYKNKLLPSLDMSYTYRVNGLGNSTNDAYDMAYQNRFGDHAVGLNLVFPIGNKAAKSNMRRAMLQLQQQKALKKVQQADIERKIYLQLDELRRVWDEVASYKKGRELTEKAYKAELRSFELGLQNSTELLDAQAQLANAISSEIRSIINYQVAQVELALATGTLLKAARFEWEEPEK